MKVLIISDTHGKHTNLKEVLHKVKPVDAVIHCGDIEGGESLICELAECPVYMVSGNNDFFSELDRELEIQLGGQKIMVCHGHNYGVSLDLRRVAEEARERGMDIVAFGHTHRPVIREIDGVTVVNPGSLAYPRQEGRRPTYIIMEIDRQGVVHFAENQL